MARDLPYSEGCSAKNEQVCGLLHMSVGTNDADTYMALALQGMGLAQFPRSQLVMDAIDAGRLVQVLTEWRPASFPLYVVYPRNRHLSARVRAFVDWAIEIYAGIFGQLYSK